MAFHTGQTFTYGETPSAAKMQYIWDNDYALADGTGIEDDAIIARHIGDEAVEAHHLATDSLLLGYVEKTSTFNTSSNSPVQVTGLSQAVTVPTTDRINKISFSCAAAYNSSSGDFARFTIWRGTVGVGTMLATFQTKMAAATNDQAVSGFVMDDPGPGAVTYNVALQRSAAGTATLVAGSGLPATLLVELV